MSHLNRVLIIFPASESSIKQENIFCSEITHHPESSRGGNHLDFIIKYDIVGHSHVQVLHLLSEMLFRRHHITDGSVRLTDLFQVEKDAAWDS